jgi:hypothetical protein
MDTVEKKLIVNSEKGNLLKELVRSMNVCERVYFSVALINLANSTWHCSYFLWAKCFIYPYSTIIKLFNNLEK